MLSCIKIADFVGKELPEWMGFLQLQIHDKRELFVGVFLRILFVTKSQFEVLDLITVDINMG